MAEQPHDDDDAPDREVLHLYYQAQEPQFATPVKIDKVVRSFRKKARKAGQPEQWREMMYTAFKEQRGVDPRVYSSGKPQKPLTLDPQGTDGQQLLPEVGTADTPHAQAPDAPAPDAPEPDPATVAAQPPPTPEGSAASQPPAHSNSTPLTLAPATSQQWTPPQPSLVAETAASRLARLEQLAVSPAAASTQVASPEPEAAEAAEPDDPEVTEEMAAVREEYLMDLFTNCQVRRGG